MTNDKWSDWEVIYAENEIRVTSVRARSKEEAFEKFMEFPDNDKREVLLIRCEDEEKE